VPATATITFQSTEIVKWPETWTAGSVVAGKPCSTNDLGPGMETVSVIEREGNYARCATWISEGARLNEALSGTGSIAAATTLVTGAQRDVVQFPASWTYDTTLAAETYCVTWAAPAGSVVGRMIVRFGHYAKCIS
jgi:hypothetical protein